jgi:dipeptidyl aminopeptidase/acylaminoacyl peptidase
MQSARGETNPPPSELCSPSQVFCVEIVAKALPQSDPYEGLYTIVVSRHRRVISQYPTEGYLLDALWSPDGRYVAVNNRRGSSGDYLWVFRLEDGKAVRVPNDEAAQDIVRRVSSKFPDFTMRSFNRRYTLGRRWKNQSDLEVRTELQFFSLNNAIIRVDDVQRVKGDSLITISETIQKISQ